MKIKDIDLVDRPKEKLSSYGPTQLTDYELLAILINTGTREYSAIELAKQILDASKRIGGLSELTMLELTAIKGIGKSKATNIVAALELSRRISKSKAIKEFNINSPESVVDIFMEELRYYKKEIVKLLLLDTKGRIVGNVLLSEGSLNSSIVHPREVFKEAVIRSASKIILVHNHPSGDSSPSEQDIQLTKLIFSSV